MFQLDKSFIDSYANKPTNFGFNGLGELTFYRTYSRLKSNGKNESWLDCVERVVNTIYEIQRRHITNHRIKWSDDKAQRSAQEMFDRIYNHKFHPPGRGFWAADLNLIDKVGGAVLNNCAFVSTHKIGESLTEATKPFEFLMDMSMLGVGVGFDVKGAKQVIVNKPIKSEISTTRFIIPDTREGWVESVKLLLESYLSKHFGLNSYDIEFNYDVIRPAGLPIKTFGGVSSGSEPLKILHNNIRMVLDNNDGKGITETTITDIMNMIGVCVVAGNVRRTAEIAFGSSEEFIDLKNYEKNPKRMNWGWTSNNSIFAELGQDYSSVAERTRLNGEPGYEWLENAQNYSRMCDKPDYKDFRALGGNPCLEQTLESYELCCLVETYPIHHESIDDYLRTLKFAYLYAKTVTLIPTHNEDTNEVLLRNRRIGTSQSGIAMYIDKYGIHNYKRLCEEGYSKVQYYDKVYSDWLKIPKSIKTTSIKPSGTVSLLAGVTPGIHYPENTTYIRRIRIATKSPLIPIIKEAGYHIEPVVNDELGTTSVVSIPVKIDGVRKLDDVSMWEQVTLASFVQEYWADNQVSCTVTFRANEGKDIENALKYFQYKLKGISFLPKLEYGEYPQMPYESISEEVYNEMIKPIKPMDFSMLSKDSEGSKYCDSDKCEI